MAKQTTEVVIKRKRGRPPGSKNKPRDTSPSESLKSTTTTTTQTTQETPNQAEPGTLAPRRVGRPRKTTNQTAGSDSGIRALPADPAELDRAIAPYQLMAGPVIGGISKIAAAAGTSPLDTTEIESGKMALGAVLYQYGAQIDAKVILAMWVAGVTLPRVVEYMEKKASKSIPQQIALELKKEEIRTASPAPRAKGNIVDVAQ